MKRVNQIRKHPLYIKTAEALAVQERDREFCGHLLTHCLDVARIAYIWNLEEHLGYEKEWIYAAALLHDLGREMQNRTGLSHEQGSALLAEKILPDCGFDPEETRKIMDAILAHRSKAKEESRTEGSLGRLLYLADKKSRNCFDCPAEPGCNWDSQKKNREIQI
ncbi:hypothetical protein B5F53_07095 [Blautia sp. An249]|uniref:HD domain-containing protein n=1 Tax=Blautia sp. An249 TaxID=1965603 RepID=UPI000B398B7C|nr:CRISPR-associated endonuclease Cas3'' [Blautia sp. An249]OUO79708.1 hypothetical protein B5F53_07095 [Blautia sp. An249]